MLKFKSFDTFIIMFAMIGTISPIIISKKITFIFLLIILIRMVFASSVLNSIRLKIIIFILILPGFFLTLINDLDSVLRFVPIFFIILGAPFFKFRLNTKYIYFLTSIILVYLIFTQIFIVLGNETLISFRSEFYNFPYGYIFDEGKIENLNQIGDYRSGGIFFNPNVLASLVALYLLILSLIRENFNFKANLILNKLFYLFIFFISLIGLILTDSRTYIIVISFFIVLKIFKSYKSNYKKIILVLPFVIYLFFFKEKIIKSIIFESGSLSIKVNKLKTFLLDESLFDILFGGRHDIFFDSEYGYWIGALGIVGNLGLILIFALYFIKIKIIRIYLIAFLLMSIGNSLFYGLLTGTIGFLFILISSSIYVEKFKYLKIKK